MKFEEKQLKEWEDRLNTRVGRCGLEHSMPKRAWFDALEAIDSYRTNPDPKHAALLRLTLKEADIYVPRDTDADTENADT